MKKVVIVGAGPAGLTAAYKLLKDNKNIMVTIIEKEDKVGGISKTVNYNGNRMDIGGHRFFTKDKEIMDMWENLLPVQGFPAKDDIVVDPQKILPKTTANPEKEDNVMLIRRRVSRILYLKKFFDYPVTLNLKTIKNLGIVRTVSSGLSYIKSLIFKNKENNLEEFYINRFGKKLYSMFFEKYTEKVWGRKPKNISALWGSQRVKGISIKEVIKNKFIKSKEVSLIEQFYYPKHGPGQLYEKMAEEIKKMGGNIIFNSCVLKINCKNQKVYSIDYEIGKETKNILCDILISSMPLKDLINSIQKVPTEVAAVARNLPYRDFVTVGILVDKIKLKNTTKLKTVNNIIPDTWIYVQEDNVKMGRIQIFNNWSPYMVADTNKIWMGLEYFCNENDDFWKMTDKEISKYAVNELSRMGFIDEKDVRDCNVVRCKKAYPAYFDSYDKINVLKDYLFKFSNLFCIGRNGQHRYNNMDHSMKTGIIVSDQITNNKFDHSEIWNVNVDKEYHEVKK